MAETTETEQENIEEPKYIQFTLPITAPDLKRLGFIFLGLFLFFWLYLADPLPDAVDPLGERFPLTAEGKAAIALFLLAGTWWVFEVIPIGVTSLAIGVIQALFLIRPAKTARQRRATPRLLGVRARQRAVGGSRHEPI